jgi:hypothetical protein
MRSGRIWRAAWLALSLAVAGVAAADNRAIAREAYEDARRHYELNDFGAALEGFKRAYLAVDDPGLLFNIAQCHRQLGNRAEAIKFYRWFIRKTPRSPQRDDAEHIVATLEAQLAREAASAASPSAPSPSAASPSPASPSAAAPSAPSSPSAASSVAAAPGSSAAAPGSSAAAPGSSVAAAPGSSAAAAPASSAPAASARVAAPASPVVDNGATPSLTAARPAPRRAPLYKKWWLWTGLGVIVAGGAVAATLALTPNNAASPPGTFHVHFQ